MSETIEKLLGWTDTEFDSGSGSFRSCGRRRRPRPREGVSPVKLLLGASFTSGEATARSTASSGPRARRRARSWRRMKLIAAREQRLRGPAGGRSARGHHPGAPGRREDGRASPAPRRRAEALLAFRGGAIIQTTCTESYQSLGDRLIESGDLTQNDVKEALDYLAPFPGMRLGDALVELGYVRRVADRGEVVKAQMAETIERLTKLDEHGVRVPGRRFSRSRAGPRSSRSTSFTKRASSRATSSSRRASSRTAGTAGAGGAVLAEPAARGAGSARAGGRGGSREDRPVVRRGRPARPSGARGLVRGAHGRLVPLDQRGALRRDEPGRDRAPPPEVRGRALRRRRPRHEGKGRLPRPRPVRRGVRVGRGPPARPRPSSRRASARSSRRSR